MPSSRLAAALLSSVISLCAACTQTRPAFTGGDAPEVDTIKLKEGAVDVPKAMASTAKVSPDKLVFPAEMASEVAMKWPAGTALVGAPGQDPEARRTNPFGFLRKVKAVRIEGESVIVDTEPALLDEVITGDFTKTLDLTAMKTVELPEGTDLSAYDVPVTTEGTPFPPKGWLLDGGIREDPLIDPSNSVPRFGTKRQAFTAGLPTFTVPRTPITLLKYKQKWTPPGSPLGLNISGQLKYTPDVSFRPNIEVQLSANIVQGLKYFKFAYGTGDLKIGGTIDIDYDAIPERDLSLVDAVATFDALKRTPIRLKPPPIPLGTPTIQEFFIGVVPFVAIQGTYLECDAKLTGTMHAKATLTGTFAGPQYGVLYEDGDWDTISRFPSFTPLATGQVISGKGGIEVECGLVFRQELLAAGVAGPYAQLKAAVVGTADYNEECKANDPAPRNHKPDAKIDFGVKAYVAAQVGVELTLARIVSIEKGPYDIYRMNVRQGPNETVPNPLYPRFSRNPTTSRPSWANIASYSLPLGPNGVGAVCMVQCQDGAKNGAESDVDCGANCTACIRGRVCTKNDDCSSRICRAEGVCAGSLCDDGVKAQQETDIDCGGPTCIPCPELRWVNNQPVANSCLVNRDCEASICSNDGQPRVCTSNLCRDGLKTNTESDIDCGNSPGCSPCALNRTCISDADCDSGSCNANTNKCVANSCLDGRVSGDESGIDCGGTCPNKCPLGQGCNPTGLGNANCTSNICSSSSGQCVATLCENGRVDAPETDVDCGSTCTARCFNGQYCQVSSDCLPGNVCNARTRVCSPPGCNDGLKNGLESSIDCGGPTCAKCAISKSCNAPSDCVSDFCGGGRCINGPCENGVKDTGEADVDCGGVCGGLKCATGKACSRLDDCLSGICANNVCVSDPCLDKVRNGSESDIDCGGTCGAKCAPSKTCNSNTDCASNLCNSTTRTCVTSSCSDGLLTSGSESDIDCGGSCGAGNAALLCAVNKSCATAADCASTVCNATTLRCVPNACFDGVKNGSETDIDCGGTCQAKCGANKVCAIAGDCQSGACRAGVLTCAPDQCSDGRLNGSETGIDCGGTCATKCAVGSGCLSGTDCVNPQGNIGVPGFCSVTTRTCTSSHCGDGVQDGNETGLDCGGACSTKCGLGIGCLVAGDCTSTFCNVTTRVCVANQCQDGLRNGTESDIDCGYGGSCSGCALSKACTEPWECQSEYCGASNTCVTRLPRSCLEIYNRNGTGDRVSGVKEIDPDGPRRVGTNNRILPTNWMNPGRSPVGWDNSILTYCDQTNDSGGWTPVIYLNSASISFNGGGIGIPNRAYSSWWWYSQSCNTDADCTISLNFNKCHAVPNSTQKFCASAGPTQQNNSSGIELLGPPGNYSVQPGGNYRGFHSYGMQTMDPYNSNRGGMPGIDFNTPPQQWRWEVYRDGVRVYPPAGNPSQIIPTQYLGPALTGNGQFANTSGPELQWFQGTNQYMNDINVLEDSSTDFVPAGLNGRGRGWGAYRIGVDQLGTYAQNGLSTAIGFTQKLFSPNVATNNNLPVVWTGLTYGWWGQTHRTGYQPRVRMAICNTFASNCAAGLVFHPDDENPGIFSANEKTNPAAGTVVSFGNGGFGTPGLVFVLWAR